MWGKVLERGSYAGRKAYRSAWGAIKSFVNTKTCTQDEILHCWAKNEWGAVSLRGSRAQNRLVITQISTNQSGEFSLIIQGIQ